MASTTVGVISDTHGLLRPEALAALAGTAHIIHAGDIEDGEALAILRRLAPVTAVRGNCDRGPWASELPRETVVTIDGVHIAVVHEIYKLTLDAKAAGLAAVVSGHTHVPACERRDGILYLNPGSAGPRRSGKPVSVGRLHIEAGAVSGESIVLRE
jgi:putative phosphoesterase